MNPDVNCAVESFCFCLQETKFVETAVIFVHHAVEFLRKHRHYVASKPELATQVEYILK